MRIKRKKLWCMLIAIILLISGMYFEDSKVDLSFVGTTMDETPSYVLTANATITDAQVCTTQMLGIHSYIRTRQLTARFAKQRRDTKLCLDYLCQNFFSLKEENSYGSFKEVTLYRDTQSNLVTKYIHKSDGKKRI